MLLPMAALAWKPSVCYKYANNLGQSIFNYNKVLKNLNAADILNIQNCDCDINSNLKTFKYKPYGHVYTGDLNIIENVALQDIMKKHAKFREIPALNKHDIENDLLSNFEEFITKWAKKTGINTKEFNLWKKIILKRILARLYTYNNDFKFKNNNTILNHSDIIAYIIKLHNRYFIVPVDNVCKCFYIARLKLNR